MDDVKAGWRRIRFGDMVTSMGATRKARGWNPRDAGIDRYVGLEHLDPDSPTIRRWGDPDAVGTNSDLRLFQPGDVILARRGIEQRKVGLATFAGVASGHALVFRARPGVVLPEFLAYFLLSAAFMGRAHQFSAGSLSKTVNLSTLQRLEFAMPPLDEQRRVAALLKACMEHESKLAEAHHRASQALEAILKSEFDAVVPFGPLQDVSGPIVRGIDSPGPHQPDGIAYVRIAEMTGPDGIRLDRLLRTTKENADAHPESRLEAGDMVVALRGVVGMPVWVPSEAAGANLSRGTARLSIAPPNNSHFFYWALRSPRVRREVLRTCTGWKGEDLREITLASLRDLRVPLPSPSEQDAVADRIRVVARAADALAARVERGRDLTRSVRDSVFGGEASDVH